MHAILALDFQGPGSVFIVDQAPTSRLHLHQLHDVWSTCGESFKNFNLRSSLALLHLPLASSAALLQKFSILLHQRNSTSGSCLDDAFEGFRVAIILVNKTTISFRNSKDFTL